MIVLTMALAAALQAEPQPEASSTTPPVPAAAKKHCTYEDVPGSNFQRRVCRTDAEEQEAKENAAARVSAGTTITRGPRG